MTDTEHFADRAPSDPEIYPDGNLQHYQEQVSKIEQEIANIRMGLDLHDKIVEAKNHPLMSEIRDRAASVQHNTILALCKNDLDRYSLGRLQGRLQALDVVLAMEPMPQAEIDAARKQITVLEDQKAQLLEILR